MDDPLALPMVSSTTGAMNSVLHKLAALQAEHPTTALGDEGLRGDLMNLNHVLCNFARWSARDALTTNEWMLQAREVIYDLEDWIDGSLRRRPSSQPAMEFWCSDEADQIREFKAQIQDLQDLYRAYNLLNRESAAPGDDVADDDPSPSGEVVTIQAKQLHGKAPHLETVKRQGDDVADDDPSPSIEIVTIQAKQLHGKVPHLETVERLRKKIVDDLTNKDHHRKVVCIVGTRGVGKTTLATQIYQDQLGQFDCGAFVHVGQNTSVNKTLASILQQVNPKLRDEIDSWDNNNCCIIGPSTLWETLKTRSYFVVLDDVRSKWTWERISCAFPNNDQSADRILVTTCVKDVAESCCIHPRDVVRDMENLSDEDSKKLFDSKVSFSENKPLDPIIHEALKICGGIPLAISFAAGLLFRKYACLPLMSLVLDQYQSTSQGIGKILEISYFDLPPPVKSCFLYLSTFPENKAIKKDRLIRRWIAEGFVPIKDESFWETGEGFVPKGDEESLWKTGESYFNELIYRRLVQPAFDDEDDKPIGCTVHGGVLDFLISLCTEENFITAGSELKLELFPFVWVRRLCFECSVEGEGNTLSQGTYSCVASSSNQISCSNEDQEDSWNRMHLSRVRSLLFSGNAGRMPDLGALKFVRVLDLEDTKGMANKNLDSIGRLPLLKYLGLVGTDVIKLPQQIMALEQLTTLDLRRTRVKNLPAFTNTKLISLLADALAALTGIGAMQNLEELSKVLLCDYGSHASEVQEFVKKFKKLRMLGVRFGRLDDQNVQQRDGVRNFLIELGNSELRSIFLDNYLHGLLDILVESWSHKRPRYLQKFELRMTRKPWLSEIPQDMVSIIALTHLQIGVSKLQETCVCVLGGLPNLLLLKLSSDTRPSSILITKDGFPHLKVFWYECEYGGIQFQKEAMPELERLRLDLNVQGEMGDFDYGMEHLSSLVQVRAIINCKDDSTASEVESDIRKQVSQNRNNPVVEFNRRGQQYSSVRAAQGPVIDIHSEDEWDEWITHIDHNKLVVVHFTAAWCGPSKMMAPFVADLAKKNPDVIFLKVDLDEVRIIGEQFDVVIDGSYRVPTFMFMREGDTQVRVVGANKKELQETLELQKALWSSIRKQKRTAGDS